MDKRVPSDLWQDQAVFVEPSYFGSLDAGISVDPLPSGTRNLHGMHVKQSGWTQLERKGDLLLKQEVHQLWD